MALWNVLHASRIPCLSLAFSAFSLPPCVCTLTTTTIPNRSQTWTKALFRRFSPQDLDFLTLLWKKEFKDILPRYTICIYIYVHLYTHTHTYLKRLTSKTHPPKLTIHSLENVFFPEDVWGRLPTIPWPHQIAFVLRGVVSARPTAPASKGGVGSNRKKPTPNLDVPLEVRING